MEEKFNSNEIVSDDNNVTCYINGVEYIYGTPEYEMAFAAFEGEVADLMASEEAWFKSNDPLTPVQVLSNLLKAMISETPAVIESLPDEQIGRMQPYFPSWETGRDYAVGDLVTYGDGNGTVYRCLQEHASQDTWTPTDAPSLWAKVLTSATDILPWEQPSSTNPYMSGDKVLWDGKTWVSDIDNNVWMPGVYGWSEI